MKINLIEIQNRAGKLKLNDQVNKESADSLISDIDKLYGQDAVNASMQIGDIVCSADDALDTLDVEINTPGGSVMEGQRIFNTLRGLSERGVKVETTVNGLAASMGSVILMAGDTRKITNGSRIMIHEASMMAYGDAKELKKSASLLENISSEIAQIYADRTGGDTAEIRNLMIDETWMDAKQAKTLGFVDSIIKDGKDQETENESKQTPSPTDQTIQPEIQMKNPFTKEPDIKDQLIAAQAEVAEHEATIARRDADAVDASEAIAAGNEAYATLQASFDATSAELVTANESITTITAELATAATDLEASKAETVAAEASAESKAVEIAAAAGHKPNVIPEKENEGAKEMTRAEFDNLTPSAKSQFSINGGKIK